MRIKPHRRASGYTLIEILLVITIIGIVGGIVVPQILVTGQMGVQAATRIVISDLMYAQNEAIARQQPISVVFDPNNERYRLTDGTDTIGVGWKGGDAASGNYVVDFSDDKRFRQVDIASANFGGETTITFDDLGTPSSGGVIRLVYNGETYEISMSDFTGRITVSKL